MARGRGRGRGRPRKIPLATIEKLITTIKQPALEKVVAMTPPVQHFHSPVVEERVSSGSTSHLSVVSKKLDQASLAPIGTDLDLTKKVTTGMVDK